MEPGLKVRIKRRPKPKHLNNPREAAGKLLVSWMAAEPSSRAALSQIINDFLEQSGPWDPRDRSLVRELVFGVVRHLSLLDFHVQQLLRSNRRLHPTVLVHLLLGAYQILFLDRIPPRAAVDEAVKAVRAAGQKWACGVVNAVLRKLAARRQEYGDKAICPDGPEGMSPSEVLSLKTSHPLWMVQRWVERYGLSGARSLCKANNLPGPVTLRVNRLKVSRAEGLKVLEGEGISADRGLFSRDAIKLLDFRGNPFNIPGLKEGLFQVQDEASQLVSLLVAPLPGHRVLDACAGLGGKTTHLAALMEDKGCIDAVDPNPHRLDLLRENMQRLGIKSINILDFKEFMRFGSRFRGGYHRVLVDAPCSGLGVIRRHPDIKWNRSLKSIREMSRVQSECLSNFSRMVLPGGALVYSVCTMEPEETRQQIRAFLSENPSWQVVNAGERLAGRAREFITGEGFLEILAEPNGPDGFFAVILKRRRFDGK